MSSKRAIRRKACSLRVDGAGGCQAEQQQGKDAPAPRMHRRFSHDDPPVGRANLAGIRVDRHHAKCRPDELHSAATPLTFERHRPAVVRRHFTRKTVKPNEHHDDKLTPKEDRRESVSDWMGMLTLVAAISAGFVLLVAAGYGVRALYRFLVS
jgi:hypothetical protein